MKNNSRWPDRSLFAFGVAALGGLFQLALFVQLVFDASSVATA
ncbi:hypothetical protein GGC65_004189 [Sphingopyxis sp. OAS728]|nr:hypothetical protein [Sphingopyxis sp. OAS728]MBE1529733.1 hypothetical protein [Sphingopyxis sp. OAS728]